VCLLTLRPDNAPLQNDGTAGGHLPGALLAGVIFCEGAPPTHGGMAGGARSRARPGTAGWLTPGGASSSITDEPDRLLGSRFRWPACWLRVLLAGPEFAGGSHRQVDIRLDLRRAASPARAVLHLERFVEYLTATYGHDRLLGGAPGRVRLAGPVCSKIGFSSAEGLRGRLPGTEAGRFGMGR
jgi:hypothetical protein